MILPAQTIRRLRLVEPLLDHFKVHGVTGGLGPCGYDVTLDQDVQLWPGIHAIHRKLASTRERFTIPNDLCGFVLDKSTHARRGIATQNTFIEPGWRGWLTVELTLHSLRPVLLLKGTPIANVVFVRLEEPTEQPYCAADKYQDQERGPQPARMSVVQDVRLDGRWIMCPKNDGGSCAKMAMRGQPICAACPHKEAR